MWVWLWMWHLLSLLLFEIPGSSPARTTHMQPNSWVPQCYLPKLAVKPLFTLFLIVILGQNFLTVKVAYSIVSVEPTKFTLSCITTGGPATTVKWTSPYGMALTSGEDYSVTQTSIYENRLTVTGEHFGMYLVEVSNSETTSPVKSQYDVTGTEAKMGGPRSYSIQKGPNIARSYIDT